MRWILAPALALTVFLAGCGAGDTPTGGSVPSGTGEAADLNFSATTIDGSAFDGDSLAGKPAVLWFWAPWCPTCRAQIPNLSALAEKYEGQVSVVGVGGLDSAASIKGLASLIPFVTHLSDPQGQVWQHFKVTAQSTYTVIGADGEIMTEGYLDDGDLNALVAQLVSSGS